MFYTVYRITNKINGKIYIGKHQTDDLKDSYMGSGKHLIRAQEKYGLDNFIKEILFQFDTEDEMNTKEAELVTEEFVKNKDTYNLCPGGQGGWGYVNKINPNLRSSGHTPKMYERVGYTLSKMTLEHRSTNMKNLHLNGKMKYDNFTGKTHSVETKRKISESNSKMVGSKNSQFGTMWITDGKKNKKVKKDIDIIPEGWYTGRVIKNTDV